VLAFLRTQVPAYPDATIVFEDRCARIGDPWLAGPLGDAWRHRMAVHGESIYGNSGILVDGGH
jgi:hypothetical protein